MMTEIVAIEIIGLILKMNLEQDLEIAVEGQIFQLYYKQML
jgi:hypothetical protein